MSAPPWLASTRLEATRDFPPTGGSMIPVPRYDATPTSGEVVIGDLATRSAFAFSSPTRTMTAKGPLLDLDSSEPEHALYTLRELAASGLGNPCLVGCHPFAEFRGE